MNAADLLVNPEALPERPVYALYGDDPFLKSEARQAILARLGGDDDSPALSRFVGDSAGLADVLDELRTLPFLAPRRIVVVESADGFVSAHRRELEAYVEAPSSTGVLVLEVRLGRQHQPKQAFVDKAPPTARKGMAERDLPRWLQKLAEVRHQAKLEPDAACLLVELVGNSGMLAAEGAKLATAVAAKGRIEAPDVARNVRAGRIETIWNALVAATTGDGARAVVLLDRLLDSGESPIGLLAAMSANLRKLYHAGELRKRKLTPAEAAKAAGIPAWGEAVDKMIKQHGHLGPGRVGELPRMLLRADLDMKGYSSLPPRAILERMLIQLARPRRD
ncbi:MAG: DNA polymerase III subunit delta [Isosphaeraceae bacterium]